MPAYGLYTWLLGPEAWWLNVSEHPEENQEKARKSSSGYNKNGSGLQGLGGETGMNRGPTEGF